ncbi:hypothetical protein HYZ99_00260 [Candidatus Peregrinibacteria bacterium]|nr:hypothetical protein [Candidatus Peregrinibacteria bacterium]
MIQSLRERLTIILIALLPFHALLVTVLTKVILGPGHAPWAPLTLWKEMLLGLILCLCILEYFGRRRLQSAPAVIKQMAASVDAIDWLIAGLILLSLGVTALMHGDWKLYLFGFKYDFIPLVTFFILRRVPWSERFRKQLVDMLLIVGGVIAAYGIVSFFLPGGFFFALGYSGLHSLYLPDAPLAAFQHIEALGVRRIQSVMSGPNQLGLWLLVPWSILVRHPHLLLKWRRGALAALIAIAIALTFSRSAWIAAAIIFVLGLAMRLSRRGLQLVLLQLTTLVVILLAVGILVAPDILLRAGSSSDHIARPLEAIKTMIAHPLGLGLGTAGPASNRISDPCVYLPEGSDASWAKDHPELCAFAGDTQVQPRDRDCNCPRLPENWYLQIGVELGVIGFVMYVMLIILVLKRLVESAKCPPAGRAGKMESASEKHSLSTFYFPLSIFLSFLGISIAALFLHAWEDSAVAYTVWMFAAIVHSSKKST